MQRNGAGSTFRIWSSGDSRFGRLNSDGSVSDLWTDTAMVAPHRSPLASLVEVDETAKADPPDGGQERSADGKTLVAAAVEVRDGGSGRLRLAPIADFSTTSLLSTHGPFCWRAICR